MVKNLPANLGDAGSIPGSGRFPRRRKWKPTPIFLPGDSHRQGSLVGYGLGGHKESYMIEHAHMGVGVGTEIYHFQEDLLRVHILTDRTPGLQFQKKY